MRKKQPDEDYFDEAAFLTMGDGKGPEEGDGEAKKNGEEAADDGVQ